MSSAIGLLFLSLGALVYEVHHISHSMQIDEIMRQIGRSTAAVIDVRLPDGEDGVPPAVPADAVAIAATSSGYLQTLRPEDAVDYATTHSVHILYTLRVGQHVVAGSPLAFVWTDTDAPLDPRLVRRTGRGMRPDRVPTDPRAGRRVRHPPARRHRV